MNRDELRQIAAEVAPRRGWDFSRMRDDRDPVPWEYEVVVRRYLRPDDRVLDVGTGGGERFLALAPSFGTGIGIDPDPAMVQTARENSPPTLAAKVSFMEGRAEALPAPDTSFDVVLNRHAPVDVAEVMRVLRPGGAFITQQVGAQNTFNIATLFRSGPGMGGAHIAPDQEIPRSRTHFRSGARRSSPTGRTTSHTTFRTPRRSSSGCRQSACRPISTSSGTGSKSNICSPSTRPRAARRRTSTANCSSSARRDSPHSRPLRPPRGGGVPRLWHMWR